MLELKWNAQMHSYVSNLSLEETINEFDGYIGCVYPSDDESYYICSGGNCKLSVVCCDGGEFYGEREVCESLCVGNYVPPKPSQDMIDIIDGLEKKLKEEGLL